MMTATPSATYRLQFREAMTFERAAGLATYLGDLGVTHLYASPLFAAVPGSTHGYDGIDFSRFEPEIGGDEGFERLCNALRGAGLGLILDIVPNHMAANEANAWWRSVLEWGEASPYGRHFDIDWSLGKLLLPILGASYGTAVAEGTIALAFDPQAGGFSFSFHGRALPLTPPSYAVLLADVAHGPIAAMAEKFARAGPEDGDRLKGRLAEIARQPVAKAALEAAIAEIDHDRLHAIHEAQVYRLSHWRMGREALTYRRFFEIADLVCLRLEHENVFTDVHARVLDLVAAGRIDGLRVDHVDGLADPRAYLERLQREAGASEPLYLLVEKILEGEEGVRPDWPIAGTTGYEFIAALAGLFVDAAGEADMSAAYRALTGWETEYETAARQCKRALLIRNLANDLAALTTRAYAVAQADATTRDVGSDALRQAIVEIVAALPVYRTYAETAGIAPRDRALIERAVADAKASRNLDDPASADFIGRLVTSDFDTCQQRDLAARFTRRFQQASGPVMAKGIEDTLFYRYERLIALNEVGGTPQHFGGSIDAFHEAMAVRAKEQPAGLSASATHDTKRGEDARARLYSLSEAPRAWRAAVIRWLEHGPAARAPDARAQWLFFQALAGAWPTELEVSPDTIDAAGPALSALSERMQAFMTKAAREAKVSTSWTDRDPAYENALHEFVAAMLSPCEGREFLIDFARTCAPFWQAGAVNSLAQLAIKLGAPGVPDIYQGSELWDFSLVDPDNRRPVDFARRRAMLAELEHQTSEQLCAAWRSGAPKLALTRAGLALRRRLPELFAHGTYAPLAVSGARAANVVAFARLHGRDAAVIIVPRFVTGLMTSHGGAHIPPDEWADTAIATAAMPGGRTMRDIMTGESVDIGDTLALGVALARFPVAILASGK